MEENEIYMNVALAEAELALGEGEVPVGAVLVKDGKLISSAHNLRENGKRISGHAEIIAMERAAKVLGRWQLDGCTLYVTLEPCLMCAGAIAQARIKTLVYGADDPLYGAITSSLRVFEDSAYTSPLIFRGERKQECQAILERFFQAKRR